MKEKPKILVVDDEHVNIQLYEAFLVPQNYDVTSATNGKDALKIVEEDDIDAILLDVNMPGEDGFEVTRK